MRTVELFAGIGGFRVAADKAGHTTIWANDLSEKASIVYRNRFGMSEFKEGDFVLYRNDVPQHELLTGGFPCQPFSSAGKKEGIRDTRGTLFQHIVDVINNHKPKYFVLENVKRLLTMEQGNHFATILAALISSDYVVEWRLLNAKDFGLPQNRERVFIIGERPDNIGDQLSTFKNFRIKLASKIDLSCLNEGQYKLFDITEWRTLNKHKRKFSNWGIACNGAFFSCDLNSFSAAYPSVSLSSVLETNVSMDFDFTESTLTWLHKNTPVNKFVNGVEILSNQNGGARMGYTIFGINGLAPTLTSTASRHYERYKVNERYRRLTNIEYARIQGFDDNHCDGISVYDQYTLYGNAVPPQMAEWVIRRLDSSGVTVDDIKYLPRTRTLFDYV